MSVPVTMALPKGTGGIGFVGEEEWGGVFVWDTGAADQTRTGPKSLEGSCATTTPQPHSVAEVMPATTIVGPAVFDRAVTAYPTGSDDPAALNQKFTRSALHWLA